LHKPTKQIYSTQDKATVSLGSYNTSKNSHINDSAVCKYVTRYISRNYCIATAIELSQADNSEIRVVPILCTAYELRLGLVHRCTCWNILYSNEADYNTSTDHMSLSCSVLSNLIVTISNTDWFLCCFTQPDEHETGTVSSVMKT